MKSVIDVEGLNNFGTSAFEKAGLDGEEATLVTDILVQADLRGVHSHGVHNLPRWARGYLRGQLNTKSSCEVLVDAGSMCVVDGDGGLGAISCHRAMQLAIGRAKTHGMAFTAVRNSSHFGPAAYFSMMALESDCIGFCTTNGPAVMAPSGGREPLLCNNPFSYAIPAETEPAVVLDMACSTVARGSVRLAARNGKPIPEGWAIDKEGKVTTDGNEGLEGAVLPFGGYKGYGIALVNEILAGVLSGSLLSHEITVGATSAQNEIQDQIQTAWGCGHLVGAIDVGRLLPGEDFKQRVDELCQRVKSSAKAVGHERVYTPGEIEHERSKQRVSNGIPLPESTVELLDRFAGEEAGISLLQDVGDLRQVEETQIP